MATRATHDRRIGESLHLLPPCANLCYDIPMSRTPPLALSEAASSGAGGAAKRPEVGSEVGSEVGPEVGPEVGRGHSGYGFHQALRSELVRRISELSTHAETTCDSLTARDFAVTIVGFVLVPLFLVCLTWMLR